MRESKGLKGPKPQIFIDGELGTTAIELKEYLAGLDIDILHIDPTKRKDPKERKEMYRKADLVVLCLHDADAKEAVEMLKEIPKRSRPRVIDTSTAHRTENKFAYGFPELIEGQADKISEADWVANPGCYATGAIALLRPLVDARLIPRSQHLTINAVSGYSGGGRQMIEAYEQGQAPDFELYGLALDHKHVAEMMKFAKLSARPIFIPSVGNFRQGMLVCIPLHLTNKLRGKSGHEVFNVLKEHYKDSKYVSVFEHESDDVKRLGAQKLNKTNQLELHVFCPKDLDQLVLVARLDNLGKGAAGAAAQNIKLMLGLNDTADK